MILSSLLQRTLSTLSPWTRHALASKVGARTLPSASLPRTVTMQRPTTVDLKPVQSQLRFAAQTKRAEHFSSRIIDRQTPPKLVNTRVQRQAARPRPLSESLPLASTLLTDATIEPSATNRRSLTNDELARTGTESYSRETGELALSSNMVDGDVDKGEILAAEIAQRPQFSSIAAEIQRRIQRVDVSTPGHEAAVPPEPINEPDRMPEAPLSVAEEIRRRIQRAQLGQPPVSTPVPGDREPEQRIASSREDVTAEEHNVNADSPAPSPPGPVSAVAELQRRIAQAAAPRETDSAQRQSHAQHEPVEANRNPRSANHAHTNITNLPPQVRRMRAMSQVEEIGRRLPDSHDTLPVAVPATAADFAPEEVPPQKLLENDNELANDLTPATQEASQGEVPVEQSSDAGSIGGTVVDAAGLHEAHQPASTTVDVNHSVVQRQPDRSTSTPVPDHDTPEQASETENELISTDVEAAVEQPQSRSQSVMTDDVTTHVEGIARSAAQIESEPVSTTTPEQIQPSITVAQDAEFEIVSEPTVERRPTAVQSEPLTVSGDLPTSSSVQRSAMEEGSLVSNQAELNRDKDFHKGTEHDSDDRAAERGQAAVNTRANERAASTALEAASQIQAQPSPQVPTDEPLDLAGRTSESHVIDAMAEVGQSEVHDQPLVTLSQRSQTVAAALDMPLVKPTVQRQAAAVSNAPVSTSRSQAMSEAMAAVEAMRRDSVDEGFVGYEIDRQGSQKPIQQASAAQGRLEQIGHGTTPAAVGAPLIERRIDLDTLQPNRRNLQGAEAQLLQRRIEEGTETLPQVTDLSFDDAPSSEPASMNLDVLAREIMPMVKRMMAIEREREPFSAYQ